MRLQAQDIYLDTLTRENCRTLWRDFEFDFENPAEELRLGQSDEKADDWFEETQKCQGTQHVRLGIFLNNGEVIGDIALQDIDRVNRKCSVGMGIAKIENRSKGYGHQALGRMLYYGFEFLGLERITACTLDINLGAKRSLEKCGFTLEGTERKAVYLNGRKYDRLLFAILKEEYFPNL